MSLDVPQGLDPIQVNLTVNNLARRPLAFDQGWFRLVDAHRTYQVGWSSAPARLAPLSARGILLRFAVPFGPRLPRLEFHDPARRSPVLIELGSSRHLQSFNPATHQHGG
jgi:hypothetical protein